VSKLLTGTCLINLINIWCFYSMKNKKPSGFLLGWTRKYGAVQGDTHKFRALSDCQFVNSNHFSLGEHTGHSGRGVGLIEHSDLSLVIRLFF
jgi:hypothetical protein